MKIEFWKTTDIKPYEANPRLNDDAVDAVAASIREFGFRQPVVVDEAGVIVVGHTRWKAAKQLGLEKVPVHVAKDMTPAQIKAYRIADNQTNTLADWDFDLLPVELAGLQEMDFDLNLLGFDPDELARLLDPDLQDGLTDPDEVPEPPDEAVTQPGDLWILGNHRLLCGDSANSEHVDRLLDGVVIHLVNSDPPYNVRVEPRSNNAIAAGNSSFSATNKHHQKFDLKRHPGKAKATHRKMRAKDRQLTNDFVSDEEFDRLLAAWFGNMARVLELVDEIAWSHKPDAVGAAGHIEVYPNSRNVIPGKVVFTVDFRSPNLAVIEDMEKRLKEGAKKICDEMGLGIEFEKTGGFDPVTFDEKCVTAIRDAAERLGYSHRNIISGAGHDACWINRVAPTAMVMCPCVDGLSHNEAEEISKEWAAAGADVLMHAVVETAEIVE